MRFGALCVFAAAVVSGVLPAMAQPISTAQVQALLANLSPAYGAASSKREVMDELQARAFNPGNFRLPLNAHPLPAGIKLVATEPTNAVNKRRPEPTAESPLSRFERIGTTVVPGSRSPIRATKREPIDLSHLRIGTTILPPPPAIEISKREATDLSRFFRIGTTVLPPPPPAIEISKRENGRTWSSRK